MKYLQLWRSARLALTLALATSANPSAFAADYTVRRGDTLSEIARQHKVPLATLQRANPHLASGKIAQGQRLSLPATAKTAPPKATLASSPKKPRSANLTAASSPAPARHPDRATPSDPKTRRPSLAASKRPELPEAKTEPALRRATPTAPRSSKAEHETTIDLTPPAPPARAGEKLQPRPSPAPPAEETYYHVVKNGETLSSIARQRGLSLAALADANRSINPKRLAPKQKLTLPSPQLAARSAAAPSPKTRPLSRPAATSLETAASPAPEAAPPDDHSAAETVSPGSEVAYLVAADDNLESIAREFSTSPQTLRQLNQLGTFDNPATGSVITVPWKASPQLH